MKFFVGSPCYIVWSNGPCAIISHFKLSGCGEFQCFHEKTHDVEHQPKFRKTYVHCHLYKRQCNRNDRLLISKPTTCIQQNLEFQYKESNGKKHPSNINNQMARNTSPGKTVQNTKSQEKKTTVIHLSVDQWRCFMGSSVVQFFEIQSRRLHDRSDKC